MPWLKSTYDKLEKHEAEVSVDAGDSIRVPAIFVDQKGGLVKVWLKRELKRVQGEVKD